MKLQPIPRRKSKTRQGINVTFIKLIVRGDCSKGNLPSYRIVNKQGESMAHFTFLVKSEKYGGICLGCLDERKKWIRPIKPGGFMERDIIMDNSDMIEIFDVVDMEFGSPFPIKHHTENMKFRPCSQIDFVKKLNVTEQEVLLKEIADTRLLKKVESKYELFDEIINSGRSLVLAGPIASFDIEYDDHPRLWIVGKNNKEFDVPCTDILFCAFIESKSADFENNIHDRIRSQDIAELIGKQTYFVVGLTGDSLDENNKIQDGKYAPEGGYIEPRYWPLVVSVLTIPSYSKED